jgi:hypothetical protein
MSWCRKSRFAQASAAGNEIMGSIVGAALVSHHPGLFQTEEFRIRMGAGRD